MNSERRDEKPLRALVLPQDPRILEGPKIFLRVGNGAGSMLEDVTELSSFKGKVRIHS